MKISSSPCGLLEGAAKSRSANASLDFFSFPWKRFLKGVLIPMFSLQGRISVLPSKQSFCCYLLALSPSDAFLCETNCCRSSFISLDILCLSSEVCTKLELLFASTFLRFISLKDGTTAEALVVSDGYLSSKTLLFCLNLVSSNLLQEILGFGKKLVFPLEVTFPLFFIGLLLILPSVESFLSACTLFFVTGLEVSSSQSQMSSCFSQKLLSSILVEY
ncbi:unnamed protein product [Moneuplotes crassus]|uniref:Uncharacterized protein n=1 Tax=Euplotes crassus TaxID=5936 RepID=A0AAD1XSJ2_EUPCR|nr:unnamed protein product [Moneuplotes crassus]